MPAVQKHADKYALLKYNFLAQNLAFGFHLNDICTIYERRHRKTSAYA